MNKIERLKKIKMYKNLFNQRVAETNTLKKLKIIQQLKQLAKELGLNVINKLLELINQAKNAIDTGYQPLQFQSDYGKKLLNIADELDTTTDPSIKQLANEVIGTHRQAMIELAKNKELSE